MKEYYSARAPEYDRIYSKPERQNDLRAIEAWLPTVFAGRRVLDLACGTGYWTQFIARVAEHVLAVDASTQTMEIAKDRVDPGKVEFAVGDAYAPPRCGYEGGFAGFWISHVPKARVRDFVAGFNTALAPGARVVLLDNRYIEGSSTPISETDGEGNTYQTRKLEDGTSHRVLKNFPGEQELREVMQGLYAELTFKTWQYYWAVEYVTAGRPDR